MVRPDTRKAPAVQTPRSLVYLYESRRELGQSARRRPDSLVLWVVPAQAWNGESPRPSVSLGTDSSCAAWLQLPLPRVARRRPWRWRQLQRNWRRGHDGDGRSRHSLAARRERREFPRIEQLLILLVARHIGRGATARSMMDSGRDGRWARWLIGPPCFAGRRHFARFRHITRIPASRALVAPHLPAVLVLHEEGVRGRAGVLGSRRRIESASGRPAGLDEHHEHHKRVPSRLHHHRMRLPSRLHHHRMRLPS